MSKPNKTVGKWREQNGRDPKAIAASSARMAADPMVKDMAEFQAGRMTAQEFKDKWVNAS